MKSGEFFEAHERSTSGFSERAESENLYPLWEQTTVHQTGGRVAEVPFVLRWSTVEPLIADAIAETTTENTERRVLLMANPAHPHDFVPHRLTPVLQGAVQTLMPGESARPHRHTANALRFVLKDGGETYTVVDGKECRMQPRDVVLTPMDTWHGHYHKGSEPTVWYDVLDAAFAGYLDAGYFEVWKEGESVLPETLADEGFVEPGLTPVMPSSVSTVHSPRFRYSWEATQRALEKAPIGDDGSRRVRFTNPYSGANAMPSLDCYMMALDKENTRDTRSTSGSMCIVAKGSGVSTINGEELSWNEFDVFTVPRWAWASHRASTDEGAVIFIVSDRACINQNSMLKEEYR